MFLKKIIEDFSKRPRIRIYNCRDVWLITFAGREWIIRKLWR